MIALKNWVFPFAIAGLTLTSLGGVTAQPDPATNSINKITFDLSAISPEGLIGPPNGLRSVSYEFCIPAQRKTVKQVQAIDPTVQYSRSRGRIGCQPNQYLCIGHTHQANWKEVLFNLAQLEYVKKIDQFWGE
ncbi:MAG: hypothetical protein VKJ02_10640 [Snowella sp.]|nr:hypothetical protein [Snowella sp.]